jgi:hypothetical protein
LNPANTTYRIHQETFTDNKLQLKNSLDNYASTNLISIQKAPMF